MSLGRRSDTDDRQNKSPLPTGFSSVTSPQALRLSPAAGLGVGRHKETMTHRKKKLRASVMRFPMIAAISLNTISCEQRTRVSDDSNKDQATTIQRIEILEQREQTLMDQQQRVEARRRAEEEGFTAHGINPIPAEQAADGKTPEAPQPPH